MQTWLSSLPPVLYWLSIVCSVPCALMALGLLIVVIDPDSALSGNTKEFKWANSRFGCFLWLMWLGMYGAVVLGLIFGIMALCYYKLGLSYGVSFTVGLVGAMAMIIGYFAIATRKDL